MATLSITIGNVSASVETSNSAATDSVTAYCAAYGGPVDGTATARAEWFIAHLAAHVDAVADGQSIRQHEQTARAEAISERADRRFIPQPKTDNEEERG
jgi:hypothetical protein